MRVETAYTVTLCVWRFTDALGGVFFRVRSVPFVAGEVTRAPEVTDGNRVWRVVTLLLVILALDLRRKSGSEGVGYALERGSTYELSEVIVSVIRTKIVGDRPRHRVGFKEVGKKRQTKANVEMPRKNI